MDLEPVAVDSCVRIELAPVAPTVVRSPWEQRVGFSLFGVELAAISWCGESTTYVEPAARPRPLVMVLTRLDPHAGCAGTTQVPGPIPARRWRGADPGGFMRQASLLPDIVVRPLRDGPLILAGTPGRLRGELHVTNAGAERASLHGFVVRKHDLPSQPAPGQLGGRLPPGASGAVTASLVLPPDTPPGEYHATLDIAGHEIELSPCTGPAMPSSSSRRPGSLSMAGVTSVQLVARNTGNARLAVRRRLARARLTSDPDLTALPLGASIET